MHGAVSKGANTVHLYAGVALSWLRTFFQRSTLSVLAMLILLVGMALAAEVYAVSAGALPGPILPKPGVGFSAARDAIEAFLATASAWDWFWLVAVASVAVAVQILQWASIRYISARVRVSKSGGKLALSGFNLAILALFIGFLWFQDLQIVTRSYLTNGFQLGGLLVWFWAAFPSEIAESLLGLQRSLPSED